MVNISNAAQEQQQTPASSAAAAAMKREKERDAAEKAKVAKAGGNTQGHNKAAASSKNKDGNGSTSSAKKTAGQIKKEQASLAQRASNGHQDGGSREATPLPVPAADAAATVTSAQDYGVTQPQGGTQSPQGYAYGYAHAQPIPQQPHYPPAAAPPSYPDPWLSSPAYTAATEHLAFVNDVLSQLAISIDEAAWYQTTFSDVAPAATWLPDQHAAVQDIAWMYQNSTRRFEQLVAAMARRALREMEQVVKGEQWGG